MDIPGLKALWNETLGDPGVCIAILDGPVERSHPSFSGADIEQLDTLESVSANRGAALAHGTHVASVIFGQHDGEVKGIAPRCRGLSVPIFKDGINNAIAPCSQLDLARTITQAVQAGAHIINISGGELSPSGAAHPILADAVQNCANNNVLIIAAVGNDGCECLHIPGALPAVLAVGAMNTDGQPLDFSNWGEQYQTQGILAPGENIPGANPDSGITTNSGTSYATPLVSGIAALLLSLQLKRGHQPDPHAVRDAILSSAVGCDEQTMTDCRRLLAGRLNIPGAITQIINGGSSMSESIDARETTTSQAVAAADLTVQPAEQSSDNGQAATNNNARDKAIKTVPESTRFNAEDSTRRGKQESVSAGITAAACEACAGGGTPPQLVFALGQLGFDFGTEARRDSIMQHMDQPANPYDPHQCMTYLEKHPWDAAAIIWTLSLDATPIYAIQAHGAFASGICQRLCEFLGDQTRGDVERVSIPGYIGGNTRLSNGQIVPVIWPDLRGMYSWNTASLVEAACGKPLSEKDEQAKKDTYTKKTQVVANFLQRVYVELRNLGTTPQERSINYAATNAFQIAEVFQDAIQAEMDLDTISVERSPICRPESDCWDVKLTFFNPSKVYEQARKVYLFTVDVSDVVPVMVGAVRSWFVR